jgi:hypothetical protein
LRDRPRRFLLVSVGTIFRTDSQVLCTEVLLCAEGDQQTYTTYGVHSFARHDPVEGFISSSHLAEVELHLAQRLCEDDV